MKCKVLVLTHGKLAGELVRTAELILGKIDLLAYMDMPEPLDCEKYKADIEQIIEENSETGLLIMTDLLGGSPFLNCSQVVKNHQENAELITGCNLPMLLGVGSEIETSSVAELKQIALESAKDGVADLKTKLAA